MEYLQDEHRRLLGQLHGEVQQIVLDLEGEFSTLGEKFDYILAGKNGDTPDLFSLSADLREAYSAFRLLSTQWIKSS